MKSSSYSTCFPYCEVQNYFDELSELMSYEELTNLNADPFEMETKLLSDGTKNFNVFCEKKKVAFIRKLMHELEIVNERIRMQAARSVLYIVLGGVDNPMLLENDDMSPAENTKLLFKLGMFPLLINALNMERTSRKYRGEPETRCNSTNICVILNILSLIVEQMLILKRRSQNKDVVDIFIEENLSSEEKHSLLFILLDMMVEFASHEKPGYPIKKILLLIRKIIMISFGTLKDLFFEKQSRRTMCGLNNDHSYGLDVNPHLNQFPLLQKVSKKDLDNYIHKISVKYRGIDDTIASESIECLKKHLYIPLSEIQVKAKDFTSNGKIETLYENMLPKMKSYMESLLKIFQMSIKLPVMNMFGDCNKDIMTVSPNMPLMVLSKFHIFESMELINKAVTGILLLLLKHFKLNHIYQFEYFSHVMVSFGAIPILKSYLERTSELFITLAKSQNRRNLFTCANVLRIVNKLIKGKFIRTKMLLKVNYKHLILLTMLNNKHLEVYSLKILKILSKLWGKKWRHENMKIMNKIFQTLRHRLLEDCSSGWQNNNDDEEMLKRQIEFFNKQYVECEADKSFEDNPEESVELTDFFKKNYEKWLEEEVFQNPLDWDIFLKPPNILL